ncbi:MAG TPA: hypothetical protein VNZ58_11280 [Thermomicrobiales bacterium]|nr:hypothetical protein [Thermomicrobiales bacterium]
MPDQTSFAWFVPSPHGDQDPNAFLSNRTMNRIDVSLMTVVVMCMIWNMSGLRNVRSIGTTMDEAEAFFLRPSTIALWIAIGASIAWLLGRFILTRETRFVLFYEAAILFLAILTPLLMQEIAGFSIGEGSSELNLVAYACPGSAPPAGAATNQGDCAGFPIEEATFQLAASDPRENPAAVLTPADEISANTARWTHLSTGKYTMFLVVQSPDISCHDGVSTLQSLERDLPITCDGEQTLITLRHPDDATHLQFVNYEGV